MQLHVRCPQGGDWLIFPSFYRVLRLSVTARLFVTFANNEDGNQEGDCEMKAYKSMQDSLRCRIPTGSGQFEFQ